MQFNRAKFELENQIFEITEKLIIAKQIRSDKQINLCLAVLENLNDEYKELTGNYRISPLEMVNFHSYKWDIK